MGGGVGNKDFFNDVILAKVSTLALCPGALLMRLGTEVGDPVYK